MCLGPQKLPEEEEDGPPVIHLALLAILSHEGLDGVQESKMKFFCLIKDEEGLLAELHSLAYLLLQLNLQGSRRQSEMPGSSRWHRG